VVNTIPQVERTTPLTPVHRHDFAHSQDGEHSAGKHRNEQGDKQPAAPAGEPSTPATGMAPDGARGRIVNIFAA
jgi:hypothetical protein